MSNNAIPNRHNWYFGGKENILKDKNCLIDQYIRYMLVRTQRIFEYTNLPESLSQRQIELITQISRFTIWKKVDGELYVFFGGLGGIPNEYYEPTKAIVVNPFLKYNEMLEIDENCVVMWNDSMHIGLMPMFNKYASHLAETDISLRYACVNSRIMTLLQADNDSAKEDAETILQEIDDGVKLGVIGTNPFDKGITAIDYAHASASQIKDLIELHQYWKASWFNDLGINSNYNMKREAINENESKMNEDALLPLIDDMLEQRKIAIDKVNTMFGTNIQVDLSSSWKKMREEIEMEKEKIQEDSDSKEGEENGQPNVE